MKEKQITLIDVACCTDGMPGWDVEIESAPEVIEVTQKIETDFKFHVFSQQRKRRWSVHYGNFAERQETN